MLRSFELDECEMEVMKDALAYYCAWTMERHEDSIGVNTAMRLRARVHTAQRQLPIAA